MLSLSPSSSVNDLSERESERASKRGENSLFYLYYHNAGDKFMCCVHIHIMSEYAPLYPRYEQK
jgi:hypothetical protein